MAALAQDALLGDRYRLSRRIAVGGMGEVWQAEDSVLHRTVAVKVLKSELTSDPTFLERFRTEARTTAALSHPGIANVFDYGEAALDQYGGPETAYLVMEFVEGEPLSAILARTGRLSVAQTLDVLGQAAAALDVAHRAGMVHRDVKPGNLLVRPDGVVKITDFGIARAADAVPLTQSGMVVGTAQYFSPEQAEGRIVGSASDVYSLGVVGYECLAGRLPFLADTAIAVAMMQIREAPPPLPPDIPAPVRALIARTMAKDPRARFATGGDVAVAVRAVQRGQYEDPVAPPVGAQPGLPAAAPIGPPVGAPNIGLPPGGSSAGRRPAGTYSQAPQVPPAAPYGPPGPAAAGYVPTGPHPGGPGTPADPSTGHRLGAPATRWGLVAATLIVFALVVAGGVVALLSHPNNGSDTGPGGGSRTASTPIPINLDKYDYVGGDVADVVNRLRALRLVPVIQVAAADQPGRPGRVIDLRWRGELTQGSEIIVVAIPNQGRGKNR